MTFCFKSSYLASSISVMSLAVSLAFSPLTTQKSLAQTANGAGATFPANLYTGPGGWFPTYSGLNEPISTTHLPDLAFNYAVRGSGAGITAFLTQTPPSGTPTIAPPVSFGATDAPLRASSSVPVPTVTGSPNTGPAVQVPVVAGVVALPFNPTGLNIPSTGLRLSRSTYVGILNGNITNWNDSRITADNGRQLTSNLPIRVVRRSDGSSNTFLVSNHLEAVDSTTPFNWTGGVGTTVIWPSSFLSASGNQGVATTVNTTPGAIGYVVECPFLGSLPTARLRNIANGTGTATAQFIAASPLGATHALTGATDLDPDPRIVTITVPDPGVTAGTAAARASAYPISGVTYLLFYDDYATSSIATGLRGFIRWVAGVPASGSTPGSTGFRDSDSDGISNADEIAIARCYAPLPRDLKNTVRRIANDYVDTAVDPNPPTTNPPFYP